MLILGLLCILVAIYVEGNSRQFWSVIIGKFGGGSQVMNRKSTSSPLTLDRVIATQRLSSML